MLVFVLKCVWDSGYGRFVLVIGVFREGWEVVEEVMLLVQSEFKVVGCGFVSVVVWIVGIGRCEIGVRFVQGVVGGEVVFGCYIVVQVKVV